MASNEQTLNSNVAQPINRLTDFLIEQTQTSFVRIPNKLERVQLLVIKLEYPIFDFEQTNINLRTLFFPSLAFTLIFLYFSDGSTIYGSSKDEAEELRTFVKGQLRVQTDAVNEELLPADTNDLDCRMSNGFSCFKSGDVRVNEHPSLVGKQTFW